MESLASPASLPHKPVGDAPLQEIELQISNARLLLHEDNLTTCHEELLSALIPLEGHSYSMPFPLSNFLGVVGNLEHRLLDLGLHAEFSTCLTSSGKGLLFKLATAAQNHVQLSFELVTHLRTLIEIASTSESNVPTTIMADLHQLGYRVALAQDMRGDVLWFLFGESKLRLERADDTPLVPTKQVQIPPAAHPVNILLATDPSNKRCRCLLSQIEACVLAELLDPKRKELLNPRQTLNPKDKIAIETTLSEFARSDVFREQPPPPPLRPVMFVQVARALAEYGYSLAAYNYLRSCDTLIRRRLPVFKLPHVASPEWIQGFHSRLNKLAPSLLRPGSVPERCYGFERRRQNLATIRRFTLFLNGHLKSRTNNGAPEVDPDILPYFYEACQKAGLLEAKCKIDSTEHLLANLKIEGITVHQVQAVHGHLISAFVGGLFEATTIIFGGAPCEYALLGLGSLARGEMNIYSDLDADLIIKDPQHEPFFKRVAAFHQLLIYNLGETSGDYAGLNHLVDGLRVDSSKLKPTEKILSIEKIIDELRTELDSLERGTDMDPQRNALRLYCRLAGEGTIYDELREATSAFLGPEQNGRSFGRCLLNKWTRPRVLPEDCRDAKADLYRPITLAIDGFSRFYGLSEMETVSCLDGLNAHLPPEFVGLLRRGLELACRLRTTAHAYYGSERETVYLFPPAGDEAKLPPLFDLEDRLTLHQVENLLFPAISSMKPRGEFSSLQWQERRIHFINESLEQKKFDLAIQWIKSLSTMTQEHQLLVALWDGDIRAAIELTRVEDSEVEAWRDALDSFDPLVRLAATSDNPTLRRLVGRLKLLERCGHPNGHTVKLSDPPKAALHQRQREIIQVLTDTPLSPRLRRRASRILTPWLADHNLLPKTKDEISTPLAASEDKLCIALRYPEIFPLLKRVFRDKLPEQEFDLLFRSCPQDTRPFIIHFLRKYGEVLPARLHRLCAYPNADGTRPSAPPSAALQFDAIRGQTPITLKPVGANDIPISQDLAFFLAPLLRGEGTMEYGRHAVACYRELLFFKLRPEFPGREFAACLFNRLLTGQSFPDRRLVKLTVGPEVYPIGLSLRVMGDNLQTLFDSKQPLPPLDFPHYCFAAVAAMLIRPEDQKADNFILHRPHPNAPGQLIDIDRDRAFVSPEKRQGLFGSVVQCKSVLFCFDLMNRPLDPHVADCILAIRPEALLLKWLDGIESYNEECQKAFGSEFIDAAMKEKEPTVIPFFLEPSVYHKGKQAKLKDSGILLGLCQRLRKLQTAIRHDRNAPLIDLLCQIEPRVGQCYRAQLEQEDRTPQERFLTAFATQYDTIQTPKSLKLSTRSMKRPSMHSVSAFEEAGWTVDNARRELALISRVDGNLSSWVEDLVHGNGIRLWEVMLPELADQVLHRVRFDEIDDVATHAAILDRITGLEFHRLDLSGCRALTDAKLGAILAHCPDLVYLSLARTEGLDDIPKLHDLCPKLKRLDLSSAVPKQQTGLLRGSIVGQGLLALKDTIAAPSIKHVKLPILSHLDISHCTLLGNTHLDAPMLRTLRCHSEALPPRLILKAPALRDLSVASVEVLDDITSQTTPTQLRFQGREIREVGQVNPLELTGLTAVRAHEGRTVFEVGTTTDQPTLDAACRIGSGWMRIHPPSRSKRASSLVAPLGHELSYEVLSQLLLSNPKVTELDLSQVSWLVDDNLICDVVCKLSELRSLDLSECKKVTDQAIASLARGCQRLERLRLENCSGLRGGTLDQVGKYCPDLKAINLSVYTHTGLSEDGVISLIQGCKQLAEVDLSGSGLSGAVVSRIADNCPSLHTANFERLKLTDEVVIEVARKCPQLTSINLSHCTMITSQAVAQIATCCPDLKSVNLSECWRVKDDALTHLAGCAALESIDLSIEYMISDGKGFSERAILDLVNQCKHLTTVNLSGYRRLSDRSIAALAQALPKLRVLSLKGCEKVSDTAMLSVAQHCSDLRALKLSCTKVTEKGIIALAQSCRRLESVDIGYEKRATDKALINLAAHCPRLWSVSFGTAYYISDAGVAQFLSLAKHLKHLKIGGPELTVQTLQSIGKHLPALQRLDLDSFAGLDRDAIDRLVVACPNLRLLSLFFCDGFGKQDAAAIQEAHPRLTVWT